MTTLCHDEGCEERAIRYGYCQEHTWDETPVYAGLGASEHREARVTTGAPVPVVEKRRCSELTKAGQPCKMHPITGTNRCPGHTRIGAVADPRASQAKAVLTRKAKAQARESRIERSLDVHAAGVRGRILARLEERWDDVVRILVDDPIASGDKKTLLEALNQGLGRPSEHVVIEPKVPRSIRELREMSFDDQLALLQSMTPPELNA